MGKELEIISSHRHHGRRWCRRYCPDKTNLTPACVCGCSRHGMGRVLEAISSQDRYHGRRWGRRCCPAQSYFPPACLDHYFTEWGDPSRPSRPKISTTDKDGIGVAVSAYHTFRLLVVCLCILQGKLNDLFVMFSQEEFILFIVYISGPDTCLLGASPN